ncbi:MAG: M3 family metallopeptidase, partial [Myxococcales bacterium]|nr:M3 family metallopeptidase [Myxococcales bacterium]
MTRLRGVADQIPLLAPWAGPHGGVPPWDQLSAAAFPAAFETALALRQAEIDVIATNPEPPTFANTLAALDDAGRAESRLEALWGVMTSNLNTAEVQAIDAEWSPKLAAARDAITFNPALFARVDAVWQARDAAGLTPEQARVAELQHRRLVQAGARLSTADQATLGDINQQLAGLYSDFANKVLADESTWVALGKGDLAGLPASLKAGYKAAAVAHDLPDQWLVMNTRSSVDPFLAASSRRDLRERVWKAFKNRGDNGDGNDTNATIQRIVALRAQRAQLLGYPSHAAWRMADTMAQTPERAQDLMMRVWPAAVAQVHDEVAAMQKLAGKKVTIEPWDYLFYAEQVRKKKYALDQEALKPYFELDHMIQGAFYMAEQLYGLAFREITGEVPVFHPDVRVWEVSDKASGAFIGLFYGDCYAREGKRSGAWMVPYRAHETFTGTVVTPVVSNNNNFVKAGPGEPVLISLDDASTLFHEFGHAIHYLVSQVNYPTLSDTPSDYVEYPSQVHERWVLSRKVLDRFGTHYQTGKPMPDALIKKVEASAKFNEGYATVEYLSAAIVDMALHTIPDGKIDPDAFERDTLAKIGAPREVAMRHRLPQFLHLFASDEYSAGYYSYLWSDVMAADTGEAFVEAGDDFDPATATKLKEIILAPGNSTDRAEAYRQFRGRDPDV